MCRLLVWFILSRLLISPALIVAAIVGLDCGGHVPGVLDLAKLVVIITACLPGALVLVVLLKSHEELDLPPVQQHVKQRGIPTVQN